jgi:hypothetical protein
MKPRCCIHKIDICGFPSVFGAMRYRYSDTDGASTDPLEAGRALTGPDLIMGLPGTM